MKRHDDTVIHIIGGLLIVGLACWATYTIMDAAYASYTAPEPERICRTEPGHKRVPCPVEKGLDSND